MSKSPYKGLSVELYQALSSLYDSCTCGQDEEDHQYNLSRSLGKAEMAMKEFDNIYDGADE